MPDITSAAYPSLISGTHHSDGKTPLRAQRPSHEVWPVVQLSCCYPDTFLSPMRNYLRREID